MTRSKKSDNFEGRARHSIVLRLIRHAESMNNQVYRQAHKIYKSGTPYFDFKGWNEYVENRRVADPGLSDRGTTQAQKLASYLVPNLQNQSSDPVRFVVSPMQRTLETVLPTLKQLNETENNNSNGNKTRIIINGLYTESEGCHLRGKTGIFFNFKLFHCTSKMTPIFYSFFSFNLSQNNQSLEKINWKLLKCFQNLVHSYRLLDIQKILWMDGIRIKVALKHESNQKNEQPNFICGYVNI